MTGDASVPNDLGALQEAIAGFDAGLNPEAEYFREWEEIPVKLREAITEAIAIHLRTHGAPSYVTTPWHPPGSAIIPVGHHLKPLEAAGGARGVVAIEDGTEEGATRWRLEWTEEEGTR